MILAADVSQIIDALGLPPEARVDARVPKKLLSEQGAPTASDKKAIQEGIDELQWLAALKPGTIGVPTFRDDAHEYLEIAIVAIAFRVGAKASRLVELIHRAIPYPVLLITQDASGTMVSVAHKRRAHNVADRVVIEGVVAVGGISPSQPTDDERAFLASLPLARQVRRDLFTLYEGWLARIEALNVARLAGSFVVVDDAHLLERRRAALIEHHRLEREALRLRAQATRARQIRQRVELNQEIKAIETAIAHNKRMMMVEGA